MPHGRLIDDMHRQRKRPVRVLVLGMCRTGTSSIGAALRRLGYTTHHMSNVLNDQSQIGLWNEAAYVTLLPDSERPAHLRGQPPYGRAEFDKLLGDYDAITDFPSVVFWKQLLEAYPDAKVILTNRKYEDWERSMNNSIWKMSQMRLTTFIRTLNITPHAAFLRMVHLLFKAHNGNHYKPPESKIAFERHYDSIRNSVPAERLLEFGPQFSWEPLCAFLGHKVPEEPYPRLNDSKVMKEKVDEHQSEIRMYLLTRLVLPGLLGGAALASAFWWKDGLTDFVTRLRRG